MLIEHKNWGVTFIISLSIVLCCIVSSRSQSIQYDRIGSEHGLSQGMVYDIVQTSDGYLWFATKNGLNRYDGYEFEIFQHDPRDSSTISGSQVTSLLEDSNDNLWVGTRNNGLNLYNKNDKSFYNIELPGLPRESSIWQLSQSPDGSIWVGSFPNTITRLKNTASLLASGQKITGIDKIVSDQIVFEDKEALKNIAYHDLKMMVTSKPSILVGCSKGLFELDQKNMTSTQIELPPIADGIPITAVYEENGSLYVGGKDLILVKKKGQPWKSKKLKKNAKVRLIKKFGNKIFFNLFRQSFFISENGDIEETSSFGELIFLSFHCDKSGNYWLGTNGLGLVKYNPEKFTFDNHLKQISVLGITGDDEFNLWIRSNHGFRNYNLESKAHTLVADAETTGKHIPTALVQDKNSIKWLLHESKNQPTFLINSTSKKHHQLAIDTDVNSSFIIENGIYWISGIRGDISRYDVNSRKEITYNYSHVLGKSPNVISSKTVVKSKQNDVIWIGTNSGLVKMQINKNKPVFTKINNAYIHHIQEVKNDTGLIDLWISTKTQGLIKLKDGQEKAIIIDKKDGLPDQEVYASHLIEDDIWSSSNRGISRYSLKDLSCYTYTKFDGLAASEFNSGSIYFDSESHLNFGSTQGLVRFDPTKVDSSTFDPPNVIVNLTVNGQNRNDLLSSTPNSFSHKENLMIFEFSALDFTSPTKNKYRYRLIGASPEWINIGERRTVTLGNINPGTYTFEASGTNANGVWSSAPARFSFTVLPPWWQSLAAYFFYLLAIAGLILYLYRHQLKEFKLKQELEFQNNEAKRNRDLEQTKTRFFSNITHELRTPLTLIQDPARRLREEEIEPEKIKLLDIISIHSDRLLSLVNSLLNLNKLNSGTINVEAIQGDLTFFIEKVIRRFEPMAKAKDIDLKFTSNLAIKYVTLDFDKLDSILSNLLSNAIKYTDQGGVVVETRMKEVNGKSFLEIDVADTGSGIAEALASQIFDRYERGKFATSEKTGSGIGLHLSKELTQLLGGSITLKKSDKKGSIFHVKLPIQEVVLGKKLTEEQKQNSGESAEKEALLNEVNNDVIILVVEDNDELREYITSCLSSQFQVIHATNGLEGLDLAVEEIPDIIITDYLMPELNGIELVKKLKDNSITSHIPIILLTAKSSIESRIEGVESGAEAYLTKPFNHKELEAYIHTFLRQRELLNLRYTREESKPKSERTVIHSPKNQLFIDKLSKIIDDNIDNEELNVDFICNKLIISRSQLHRKIKQIAGYSTSQFINNYRLDSAYELLTTSSYSIKEVSYKVGFSSPKYFSKLFKEKFGKSPKEM